MPKAVPTLSWSAAQETYLCAEPQSAETRALAPESPAWLAWLAERSSFAFHGQGGSYTARLEAVQRGERYWFAYLRLGQRVRKKYLGKTSDLTVARLEQVARDLDAERAKTTHHAPAAIVQDPTDAAPARSAQPLQPWLATKFYVPRSPVRLIPRAHLIERLRQGFSQSLILLCAPAGFGKTTLVTEFLADCGLPAAWLSLDEEDNDPQRFLSALLAAFQTRDPSIGASLQAYLSSPHGLQGLSLSAVFTQLASDLVSRANGDFLLVLDDYHTIILEPLQQAIARLVEHCPPTLHLLLVTRSDPRLPLARLRARGQLCELRARDLQFTLAEADSFLRTALERDLEPSTVATILSRTEGWIAGLQLTALLLQGQRSEAEVRQVLADTLGTHRYLVEYLGEEVFSRQPEAVQSFLLQTCILSRLSAPLCAAVSGASLQESAAMLAALERANLFLVPLDAEGEWYRYHSLWASVLRVLLRRLLGVEGLAELYGRASQWYEQHDLPAEAIEAAIQAGEYARAVDLVEQLSPRLLARSQYTLVGHWLERLPRDLWARRPIVCLASAWSLFFSGVQGAYTAPLEQAEGLFRQLHHPVGVGMVEVLRGLAALLWADGREALRAGQQAVVCLPEGDLALRGLSMSVVGGGYWLLGEVQTAWQQLVEARKLQEPHGTMAALPLALTLQGHVLASQGQLHAAAEHYQQVIEAATERRENAIEASIRQAMLCYEWNTLSEAESLLAEVLVESPTLVASTFFARGILSLVYLVQARIRQVRGEQQAASRLLRQAVTIAQQRQQRRLLAQAQDAQVRFWLANGQMEPVTRWRDAWMRADEATSCYEDEQGALTLARVLIAQGKPGEALQLLDGFRALARAQGRMASELELLVLCSIAEDAQGKSRQAVHLLEQALMLAEPEGYVRLFVDEGVPMLSLLQRVASRWKRGRSGANYVGQLLGVLQADHTGQAELLASQLVALSQRERLILRGLAQGHSTAQMAAELVVSPNTVKSQRSHLYRKLNVHSREAALEEAVRRHLL